MQVMSLISVILKKKTVPFGVNCVLTGGKNSIGCTLILTEGDSAKTLAVSGLGVVGRDRYGVFPLRGKMLNVREASHKQVALHSRKFRPEVVESQRGSVM